jgi:hypothetical protein
VEVDTLNTLVTDAIWRAEELESCGRSSAAVAWAEVSTIEEDLARAHSVSEVQGRIARRGAVTAALKARDYTRAYALVDGYLAEENAPESLKTELREILEENAQAMADRFQYASRHHSLREAQSLASRLRSAGPFGMAA